MERPNSLNTSRSPRAAEAEGTTSSANSTRPPSVDNSFDIMTKIAKLYADRLMSDVRLVVGETEYHAHRLILCASSDVFQVMLMNPNWSESLESRIVLRETPSCEAVFEGFLKYFYTGKITFDFATVPILSLADKYNVKDLLEIGLSYMRRNVSNACRRNQVVSWYQFASGAGHADVAALVAAHIRANFETVSENVDFSNCELDTLLFFADANDLVMPSEMTFFRAIDRWIKSRRELLETAGEDESDIKLHMDQYVHILIPHVRFPMMAPSQLADLLLSPISETHTEFIVAKIRLALNHHKNKLPSRRRVDLSERDLRQFTPRLYTDEKYCAYINIEHLRSLEWYSVRSLVFSSHKYNKEFLGDEQSEWIMDVYPRGVWYQRCVTVYQPSPPLEVPESVLRTVRISLWTKQSDVKRVKIGLIIYGEQDRYEHVRKVITRNFIFNSDEQVVNFDDVLDFEDLNHFKDRTHFLVGPERSTLKIMVTVTPLSELSSLELR